MGCGWTFAYTSCSEEEKKLISGLNDDTKEYAESLAQNILDSWTGGVYGLCFERVRPCRVEGSRDLAPVMVGGTLRDIRGACPCKTTCACETFSYVELPYPTHEVVSVRVDGVTLPNSAWQLEEHRYLVRTDGGAFPATQDMNAPATEPGTFEIYLSYGIPVPLGGRVAAGALALEFMRALCGDSECKLPQRVQTITRQGVTMALQDSYDDLERGRTGIWLVDSWVAAVTAPKYSRITVTSLDRPAKPRNGGLRRVRS